LPIQTYNLNDKTSSRKDLLDHQLRLAVTEKSGLDLAIRAYIEKHLRNKDLYSNFNLEHAVPWAPMPAETGKTNLRIHFADPSATNPDFKDILEGLRDSDVAVVYVNAAVPTEGVDKRLILIPYSRKNQSVDHLIAQISNRGILWANIAKIQVRIAKLALKESGTIDFLQAFETQMGQQRLPTEMFLLLPLNDQINAMIPIRARDLGRMMDFERLSRRLLQMQA
jgi:hypothetical protein